MKSRENIDVVEDSKQAVEPPKPRKRRSTIKRMTRYEKISIIFSAFALFFAICSPFISYYWFDPQIQAFQNRGKIKAQRYDPDFKGKTRELEDLAGDGGGISFDKALTFQRHSFSIEIQNVGNLPAKDVLVVYRFIQEPESEDHPQEIEIPRFSVSPILPIEVKNGYGETTITFKQPLVPNSKIILESSMTPSSAWVANEFGEGENVPTPLSVVRICDEGGCYYLK